MKKTCMLPARRFSSSFAAARDRACERPKIGEQRIALAPGTGSRTQLLWHRRAITETCPQGLRPWSAVGSQSLQMSMLEESGVSRPVNGSQWESRRPPTRLSLEEELPGSAGSLSAFPDKLLRRTASSIRCSDRTSSHVRRIRPPAGDVILILSVQDSKYSVRSPEPRVAGPMRPHERQRAKAPAMSRR